jgi:two-component system chemotaxis response regulator CheB
VIVIGASAGGVDALSTVVGGLPADLPAPVLVVLHVTPRGKSVLPQILTSRGRMPAHHALDGEPLVAGHVYVAPPDRHLAIEDGVVRLNAGPRENGVRPALDPLFRSAADVYGPGAVGVVLSGTLDDGTAGLIAIKRRGGVALVQDPDEAMFPSMPASAVRLANPDYVAPLEKLPELLVTVVGEKLEEPMPRHPGLAHDDPDSASAEDQPGEPSEFTCPECGGTLWEQPEGELLRFRCRVGHAFSSESLLTEQREALEAALWTAVTALEERADLARRLAERMGERHHVTASNRYLREADEARARASVVRDVILQLNTEAPEDG